jgi:catechol 2,3-dioxygenase-like lactoylglutathione lyase family enzyme
MHTEEAGTSAAGATDASHDDATDVDRQEAPGRTAAGATGDEAADGDGDGGDATGDDATVETTSESTTQSGPDDPDGQAGPLDVVDLDHVAIRVSDLDRSLAFYRDVLGLPERDRDRFEAGAVPYVAVAAGGRHLHLVPSDGPIDVGGEHVCLLVRSTGTDTETQLRELLSRLEAAGVPVESGEPVLRYGAYGRDWAAYVRDPDGRRVELKIH